MSWLPIGADTIRYGSSDAGETVYADDDVLTEQMKRAGEVLNLAGHMVGRFNPQRIYTCGDIEGHLGRDGRYYVLDFARYAHSGLLRPPCSNAFCLYDSVFPAEYFPEGDRNRHGNFLLYRRLRPELVKHNPASDANRKRNKNDPKPQPEPLNSDAFSKFSTDPEERRLGDEGVKRATRRLLEKAIPKMANMLMNMKAYELIDTQFNLCNEMHRLGVRFSGIPSITKTQFRALTAHFFGHFRSIYGIWEK